LASRRFKETEVVDTYNAEDNELQIEKTYNNLSAGKHEVVVSVADEKNPSSKERSSMWLSLKRLSERIKIK